MKTVRNIIKHIEEYARKSKIESSQQLNVWLDYMIDYFDYRQYLSSKGLETMQFEKYKESPELFKATYDWMLLISESIESKSTNDFLGRIYEELFQTKMKSSKLGQFFTPECLCDLMAMNCAGDSDKKCLDCSCGSGRTLIAHHMELMRRKKPLDTYYIGGDIDLVSVKMCALNLMIYGMRGRVVRQDALVSPVFFDYGFEINEVRYPFPTPFYSLRRISFPEEPKKDGEKNIEVNPMPNSKPDKNGQYSLF